MNPNVKNKKADRSTLQPGTSDDLNKAVDVLRKGGIILYPTDTVWGIGCDATNAEAIARIYKLKQRAEAKAMITLVCDLNMLERTVTGIADVAYDIMEFSTKPITIIYDRGINVAPNILAHDGSLAVRVCHDRFASTLCSRLGKPLVSTSANISGQPTPANYGEISEDILEEVDYVCTTRRDEKVKHKSSTIMRLSADGEFKIIRP